jgi:ADP-dependent NAD(P)H-hydrate dehydratase / NAD(P)H-hydrate epimerase
MLPIVTPSEMAAIDAAAAEPVDVLVDRAGAAVASQARRMLGGTYGRVVNVLTGRGNNGADGRVAGERLRARGALVRVFDALACPASLPPGDLVIDAAFGTGYRGGVDGRPPWSPPDVDGTPVLAVDMPSGVDGLTGDARGPVLRADVTVTFAALKPGLLLAAGKSLAGDVVVVDIGLDTSGARAHLVTVDDVRTWWRPRPVDAHKWSRAVRIVAGSPGMTGAAALASAAAMRAGAGIVWLSAPGLGEVTGTRIEVVTKALPARGWADDVLAPDVLGRFGALVVGPGLGRAGDTRDSVRGVVARASVPTLVDGDGLSALSPVADTADALRARTSGTVLTPHDGEYRAMTGEPASGDRMAAARSLAALTGAVVLLKGPSTVVAAPDGAVRVVANGDERLATAGSGDVLSGIIGALLAAGIAPLDAASAGAWLHADAARRCPSAGLVAGDLPDAVGRASAELGR